MTNTAIDPRLSTSGMWGTATNKDVVNLLISGGQLTLAGQALANVLPQLAPQMKVNDNGGLQIHPSAAHYLANVPAHFTNEQYFVSYINHTASLWHFYQQVLQQQAAARAEIAAESVRPATAKAKPPKIPKLVRHDGHLTEAGANLSEWLDSTYRASKLPITPSTRAYVAHRFLIGESAVKALGNHPSLWPGLVEVMLIGVQKELLTMRAELDAIEAGEG